MALAIKLFTESSLNTYAKSTNVGTDARILCYDIRDLGKQLLPVGMLVVLDSVFNRVIRKGAYFALVGKKPPLSNFSATKPKYSRMGRCCGQDRSHFPHLTHSPAFPWPLRAILL